MALLIRRFAPDGARTEETLDGAITIGRGTDNTVQLPGLLVALHHLRLTPTGEFGLHLECPTAAGVTVNGLAGQRSAEMAVGDDVDVGGHRIRVGLDDAGTALMLEIHERDPQRSFADGNAVTSLAEAGWRMRRPALISAGVLVLLLLIAPLVLRALSLPPALAAWLPTDQLWSSGRISDAHRHFGDNCASCHEGLFTQVRDQACLTCHAGIKHHGDDAQAVADAGLDQRRCASCHLEHGSPHAVLPRHPAICSDCHGQPQRFPQLAQSPAVSDFASEHPGFRATVAMRTDAGPKLQRALLTPELKDANALIYPHDLHLDLKGVRGPQGTEVLQCADCHRPGPGDVGFQPLRYERDCQRCHQLDVDVGGLPYRLPHGDTDAVRTLLETAVGMPPVVTQQQEEQADDDRRRPGSRARRGEPGSVPDQIDEVFERRVCAKCHEIERPESGLARVRAPQLRQTWMPMARFTHAPHQWVACDSCHKAGASSTSDDLLLPQIDTCRLCHGGVGSSAQIQSTCIDCHRFHQAETLAMSKFMGELANGQTLETGK